jgi:hypothetical protein
VHSRSRYTADRGAQTVQIAANGQPAMTIRMQSQTERSKNDLHWAQAGFLGVPMSLVYLPTY